MTYQLTRTLTVERHCILATIAEDQKGSIYLPVLRLAADSGPLTPAVVQRELMSTLPESVSQRMLAICEETKTLRVEDGAYRITEEGSEALDRNALPTLEHGVWHVWTVGSEDPLLPHSVIDVQRAEREHGRKAKGKRKDWEDVRLPEAIRGVEGRAIHLPGGRRLRIDAAESSAERHAQPQPPVSVRLEAWPLTDAHKLSVKLPRYACDGKHTVGKWIEIAAPDGVGELDVPGQLRADGWQWNADTQRQSVAFEQTDGAARTRFTQQVTLSNATVGTLGRFDRVEASAVPLESRSERDAQAWARWLLENEIDRYVTPGDYENIRTRVAERFDERYGLDLPSQTELAERMSLRDAASPAFWYLQAPLDWAL